VAGLFIAGVCLLSAGFLTKVFVNENLGGEFTYIEKSLGNEVLEHYKWGSIFKLYFSLLIPIMVGGGVIIAISLLVFATLYSIIKTWGQNHD
jgi:hypothetical protein